MYDIKAFMIVFIANNYLPYIQINSKMNCKKKYTLYLRNEKNIFLVTVTFAFKHRNEKVIMKYHD